MPARAPSRRTWWSGAVLTPILATDDPYQAAADFIKAGWSLIFQTPRDSGDPLACVNGTRPGVVAEVR